MKKTQLFKTDGTITNIEPKNGKNFQLQELYELLNCELVEIAHAKDGRIIIVDEEGRLNQKEFNVEANNLYVYGTHPGFQLVGDAIICPAKFFK